MGYDFNHKAHKAHKERFEMIKVAGEASGRVHCITPDPRMLELACE